MVDFKKYVVEDTDEPSDAAGSHVSSQLVRKFDAANKIGIDKSKRIFKNFIMGPVPLLWIMQACCLGAREARLAWVIWYFQGLNKNESFKLSNVWAGRFGLSRDVKTKAIQSLVDAGLIKVDQSPGCAPLVTVLIRDEDYRSWKEILIKEKKMTRTSKNKDENIDKAINELLKVKQMRAQLKDKDVGLASREAKLKHHIGPYIEKYKRVDLPEGRLNWRSPITLRKFCNDTVDKVRIKFGDVVADFIMSECTVLVERKGHIAVTLSRSVNFNRSVTSCSKVRVYTPKNNRTAYVEPSSAEIAEVLKMFGDDNVAVGGDF